MKKILICISLLFVASGLFKTNVFADDYPFTGDAGYHVYFDENGKEMKDDKTAEKEKAINDKLLGLQPGDSVTITYEFENHYKDAVDVYMSNEVLRTFEQISKSKVAGGNYTYSLKYSSPSQGDRTLFDSETVAGEGSSTKDDELGMKEATDALKDWLVLNELMPNGEKGVLTLHFAIDGESQMNNYQDVAGQLQVRFAVELPVEEPGKPTQRIVYIPYTGDTFNATYYIIAEVLSLILLLVVIWRYLAYRRRQEGSK